MASEDYQYVFKRLDKIRKTCEHLINRNIQLNKINAQLRLDRETFEHREAARERVLRSLQEAPTKET